MNSGCSYVGIDEVIPFGLETEKRKSSPALPRNQRRFATIREWHASQKRSVRSGVIKHDLLDNPLFMWEKPCHFYHPNSWEWFILMVTIAPIKFNGVLPPRFSIELQPDFSHFAEPSLWSSRVRGDIHGIILPWRIQFGDEPVWKQIVSDRRTVPSGNLLRSYWRWP